MKTESIIFLQTALYDLVYLLEFQNEQGAAFYNEEVHKILVKFKEMEEYY